VILAVIFFIDHTKSKLVIEPTGQILVESETSRSSGGLGGGAGDLLRIYFNMSVIAYLMRHQEHNQLFSVFYPLGHIPLLF
jgi:hypothetical protein